MRKSILFLATVAALGFLVGGASATVLTEQQVKNTCGSSLQTGSAGGATASGCEKACGSQICTYNCCSGKGCGEQGCNGHVVGMTTSGQKVNHPLPASVLKEIKASSSASPSHLTTPSQTNVLSGSGSNLTTRGSGTSGTGVKMMKQNAAPTYR